MVTKHMDHTGTQGPMASFVGRLDTIGLSAVRKFDSGATRSSSDGKPDFEGFISPLVEERYGEYMHKHRLLPDGTLRASDNWQSGIPQRELLKSGYQTFHGLETV